MLLPKGLLRNRKLIFLAKVLVSGGIILFLFQRIDLRQLTGKLLSLPWSYLWGCFFLFMLCEILHSLRWKILLNCRNINVSTLKLLYLNFVGLFFNLSFPTSLGGDVVRIYQMSIHANNTSEAVTSVVVDRGVGFFTLLAVAPIMILFSAGQTHTSALFAPAFVLLLVVVAAIFILFRLKRPVQVWCSARGGSICQKIIDYYDVMDGYRGHKRTILLAMMLSLGMIFLVIMMTYLISQGLRLHVPLAYFIIFVPIIFLITMIPVSIHGLGLREGAFVFFFARAGLAAPEALSISLISYVVTLVFGLVGGLVYMLIGSIRLDRTAA